MGAVIWTRRRLDCDCEIVYVQRKLYRRGNLFGGYGIYRTKFQLLQLPLVLFANSWNRTLLIMVSIKPLIKLFPNRIHIVLSSLRLFILSTRREVMSSTKYFHLLVQSAFLLTQLLLAHQTLPQTLMDLLHTIRICSKPEPWMHQSTSYFFHLFMIMSPDLGISVMISGSRMRLTRLSWSKK